jgi:DNA end-binding protein Ku
MSLFSIFFKFHLRPHGNAASSTKIALGVLMAARSTASASISFGLVSIPVKMYTTVSSHHIGFHMLHKKCGTRVKQQLICPYDKEVVERSETMRGFEHGKERYVEITDEDLDAVRLERTDRVDILEFVPEETVDILYLDRTHFLGPDKGAGRAYKLLADAMERNGRIAVGRFGVRGQDQLVLLRPYKGGLVMHQMHYADEVRSIDDIPQPGKVEFKKAEQDLADQLVDQLSTDAFHPEKYHDEYEQRLMAAIEQKVAGQEIAAPPERPEAQVIDLFEALKRSLGGKPKPGDQDEPPAQQIAQAEGAQGADEEEAPAPSTKHRPAVKKATPRTSHRKTSREKKSA